MDAMIGGIRVTACKHSFHSACLDRWVSEKPSCPICRFRIPVVCKQDSKYILLMTAFLFMLLLAWLSMQLLILNPIRVLDWLFCVLTLLVTCDVYCLLFRMSEYEMWYSRLVSTILIALGIVGALFFIVSMVAFSWLVAFVVSVGVHWIVGNLLA